MYLHLQLRVISGRNPTRVGSQIIFDALEWEVYETAYSLMSWEAERKINRCLSFRNAIRSFTNYFYQSCQCKIENPIGIQILPLFTRADVYGFSSM